MVANTGPKTDSSAEAESAEGPSAVATITRLIRDLYGSNRSRTAISGKRDSDLIIWSEMLGAVRVDESASAPGFGSTPKATSASTHRSPIPSGS
jgi:hypothetical protein